MQDILRKAGLSEKAAAIYLTCLQLGPAVMTDIARTAGLKRPTAYLIIDELIRRGYITSARKGKRVLYAPEHPRRILQTLRMREMEVSKRLPELEALYYGAKDRPRIRVFEGKEAMLQIYEDVFSQLPDHKGELLFFTATGDLGRHFPEALERFYNLLRENKRHCRIRELNVWDEGGKAYAKKIHALSENHAIRFLDRTKKMQFANTDNLIFGDMLVTFSVKKDIFAVVIEHKDIADTYRALFNAAWEGSKEVPVD